MKYPSQEDCQVMVDIMNREIIFSRTCSDEFRKLAEAMEQRPSNWSELYEKCFGENSPWDCVTKPVKNNPYKRELKWNKSKYELLKLKENGL